MADVKTIVNGHWVGRRGYPPAHLGKTPPLCLGVGCRNQVKRQYGVRLDRAPRVVDGVAWRRFCGYACSSANAIRGAALHPETGVNAWRLQRFRARVLKAKADLAEKVDAHGRVALADAVRYAMAQERKGYMLGFTACWQRLRRGTRVETVAS